MEVQKGCGIFYLRVLRDMALTVEEGELGNLQLFWVCEKATSSLSALFMLPVALDDR